MIRRHLMTLRLALMLGDGITAALVFLLDLVRPLRRHRLDRVLEPHRDRHPAGGDRVRDRLGGRPVVPGPLPAARSLAAADARPRTSRARRSLFAAITLAIPLRDSQRQRQPPLPARHSSSLQPIVTFAERSILRFAFSYLRERGYNTRYMLVVGTGELAQDFADLVEARAGLGIRVIGHLSVPARSQPVVTRPILGTLDSIEEIFHTSIVDEVAACLPRRPAGLPRAGRQPGGRRGQDGPDPGRPARGRAPERARGGVRGAPRSDRWCTTASARPGSSSSA